MTEISSQNLIILKRRVYYVNSPEDSTVIIALDVKVDGDFVIWFDTVKDRIMRIDKIMDNNSERFVFKRKDYSETGVYTFIPMTLDVYKDKVKNKILIPQDFSDEEEMLRAFEETKKSAW